MYIRETPTIMAPEDYATGTNAALTITYPAAGVGLRHNIGGIAWSFSAAPAAPVALTVQDRGNTILSLDVTGAGPGAVNFDPPKCGAPNAALVITLAAGGAGVVGKLNILSHWVDKA